MSNKVVITYSLLVFLSWIKNMYIIIFQIFFLLPNLFFFQHVIGNRLFFCLAPGTRAIDLPEL